MARSASNATRRKRKLVAFLINWTIVGEDDQVLGTHAEGFASCGKIEGCGRVTTGSSPVLTTGISLRFTYG